MTNSTDSTHSTDLTRRAPEDALAFAEDYARLNAEDRKRRAAEALRDAFLPGPEDAEKQEAARATLWALTRSHVLTYGKKGLRVSEHTLAQYRRGLDALVGWCEAAGQKPHQLDTLAAKRYTRHLEALGLAPASVNARLSGARAFMGALAWAGMMTADPFAREAVTDPTPAHEKRAPYSRPELDRLLAAGDAWERALVLVAADAGLRASEAVALEWPDVDLPGRRLVVKSGKGGKRRTVALTERCAEALAALAPAPSGRVFSYTRQQADYYLRRLCDRAGVTCRGMHALRHSCGTRLYQSSRDLVLVARHLGHATTRPTEGYTHLAAEDYARAVEALGEARTPAGEAA